MAETRDAHDRTPEPAKRLSPGVSCCIGLDSGHSDRLGAFGALGDLELNSLILLKSAKTAPLDLGMVDEDVLLAAIRGDKSEAFFGIEPFHSSLRHTNFSLLQSGCNLDTSTGYRSTAAKY